MKTTLLAASIGLVLASAVSAALHANPALAGCFLASAFVALGAAAGAAAVELRAPDDLTEPRHRPAPAMVTDDVSRIGRATAFGRLWAYAAGAFALAAVVPFIALARRGRSSMPVWTRGARLVTPDGRPVRTDDVSLGGVMTVFPEGHVEAAEAAVLLIRVEDDALTERRDWAPGGNLAFSKICTHAGCPVAIYRHADHTLYCPCHQSEFAVLSGAKPVAGPATRALPQLGLDVRGDGYLVARGDFSAPVGPDDWSRAV